MGKGSYLGGGTVFTFNDLGWFGAGGVEVPKAERKARIKAELLRQRQAGPPPNPTRRQRELHDLLKYSATIDRLVDMLADEPTIAAPRPILDPATEKKISELKKDLSAFAAQARSAAGMHEACRQDLLKLLARNHLSEEHYPEARKLSV